MAEHQTLFVRSSRKTADKRLSYGMRSPSCKRFTICRLRRRLRFNTSDARPLEPIEGSRSLLSESLLLHSEFGGLDRINHTNREMLELIGFDERHKDFHLVCL